tara:strand:- start:35291 stop:35674 length:384 start_codon:yes stop_codon:yes gene_type:complete
MEVRKDLQILKLKVIFGRKYKDDYKHDKAMSIHIKAPIRLYHKDLKSAFVYLSIEDRLFFSPSLNQIYKFFPKETKKVLIQMILEGITVSENSLQTINITTDDGNYCIGDIYEILTYGDTELTDNNN